MRQHALTGATQVAEIRIPFVHVFQASREYEEKGDDASAIAVYRQWLVSNPNGDLAHYAWFEFARLLQKFGQLERARFGFQAALEQKGDYTEAALALGYLLEASHNPSEAVELWRTCKKSGGDPVVLLNNIARVCDGKLFQYEIAESALTESLQILPGQRDVISTLLSIRQRLCMWPIFQIDLGVNEQEAPSYFGPLSSLAFFNDPAKNLLSAKAMVDAKWADNIKVAAMQKYTKRAGQKIKIGFYSADFRLHATSVFFAPIIARLNREVFEIFALDITVQNDPFGSVAERLLGSADHHIPLQLFNDDDAAECIKSHHIDILVDMSGLTASARPAIIVKRVAPVQISYLGFIGSSGMEAVDYILTAADMFPEEGRAGYSEVPLILDGPYVAIGNDLIDYECRALTREECGLPQDAFVYCALVNSYKITPEVFNVWLNILSQVEEGVIWLLGDNPTMVKNLVEHAAKRGIHSGRIVFLGSRVHPAEYRARLKCADLFLDTSPYGNGATAREAILANLPILTCPGNTMMSRFSAHLMGQLGMDDFVVETLEGYERFAVVLGMRPQLLAGYKERMLLARETSNLFNVDLFVERFGKALLEAYLK